MSDITVEGTTIGSAGAFEELYLRRASALHRLALRMVDRPDVADEIVHDAFARLLERWHRIDDPEAYLRTAVLNRSRDVLRRRRVARLFRPDRRDEANDIDSDHLQDAIRALPTRQRAVVVLRFYEDLSVADTAQALHLPEGTVKSDLHRALLALRKVIER